MDSIKWISDSDSPVFAYRMPSVTLAFQFPYSVTNIKAEFPYSVTNIKAEFPYSVTNIKAEFPYSVTNIKEQGFHIPLQWIRIRIQFWISDSFFIP